jgi:hypothetical protein
MAAPLNVNGIKAVENSLNNATKANNAAAATFLNNPTPRNATNMNNRNAQLVRLSKRISNAIGKLVGGNGNAR